MLPAFGRGTVCCGQLARRMSWRSTPRLGAGSLECRRATTHQEPVVSWKFVKAASYGLVAIVIVTTCAAYVLPHSRYVSRVPIDISRNFIALIQAGDLGGAYLLTDQKADVGSTLADFEANIRYQLAIDVFPANRPIKLIGTQGGFQSYGNRLRRWVTGRKTDPDQVNVDYFVGLPFEVSLRSNDRGEWRITYFQSHAM
jgi:hypothetical protein